MKPNLTFKKLYPNYETFQNKIIDIIQEEYPDSEWCSYEKMLTSWKNIYKAMYRTFNWRTVRYEAKHTHNLIINQFIEYLPEFYLKQRVFLKTNLEKFDDVKNLGEILTSSKNLIQSQLQNASSTNATENFVSPQGFIESIEEMAISEGQKADSKSLSDIKSSLNLDTKDDTYRYTFLNKLQELANSKFRYFLKELLDNFNHIFRVVQVLTQGDENIYLKLKDVLIDSKNIKFLFDDKTFTVTCDLKNVNDLANILEQIEETLNKKVDIDFKNVSLKTIVSPEPTNNLIVDKNNQLFAKGGSGGGKYIGDNKTVKIDEKNVVSAIGLINDNQIVLTTDNIREKFQKANEIIYEVKNQIQQNEISLAKAKKDLEFLNELFTTEKIKIEETIKEVKNLENISVDKTKLRKIVSQDKKNSLKIGTDNNLYVPTPEIPQSNFQWELVQDNTDWEFVEEDQNKLYWKNKKQLTPRVTSAYLLIFKPKLEAYTKYISITLYGSEAVSGGKSYVFYVNYDLNGVKYKEYCIEWNFNSRINLFELNFIINSSSRGEKIYFADKDDKFWIYERKNVIPANPTPPTPTFTKEDIYNTFKKDLKNE